MHRRARVFVSIAATLLAVVSASAAGAATKAKAAALVAPPTTISINSSGELFIDDYHSGLTAGVRDANVRVTDKGQIVGIGLEAGTGCVGQGTGANPISCWWGNAADGYRHLNALLMSGNDRLVIDAPNVLAGVSMGPGNDVFLGGPGPDHVNGDDFGGNGRDKLDGRGGDDAMGAGPGDDVLKGGPENDSLAGDSGKDVITGGAGDDRITGGYDDDKLRGGGGNDKVDGGSGKDLVSGGDGDDVVSGGTGVDTYDEYVATSPNDTFDFSYRFLPPGMTCTKYFYWSYYKIDEGDLVPNKGVFTSYYGPFTPPPCS